MKPQALDKSFCYKCNGTKREAGRADAGPDFQEFQKKLKKKVKKRLKK